jgi:hypothetical protein
LVTPALGTPSSGILSSCTGYAVGNLTGTGTGVLTALAVNVGSAGSFVTFNGALGTPSSGNLSNCTGYPVSGLGGLGTGVATALAVNVGSAGAFVVNGGALGTPSSGTLTNATGLPISTGVDGLGAGVATFLATPSSANLASAVTDETGSGPLVFATSPTFTSQVTFGTASSTRGTLVLANTSANTVTLQSSNTTAANYTLTFPAAAPVNGYYLQTDTNGVLSWAAGGGGGGGSPGGSNTQVQFNNAGAFGGDAAFTFANGAGTATLTLGIASTTSAALTIYNSSSANGVTIASGNNSAAWTMTLPTSAGSNGQVLQTNGSGATSWVSNDVGIAIGSSAITGGTSGRILYDNAGVVGEKTVTGTGDVVLATSPTLVTPALGTPSSGDFSTGTFTWPTFNQNTTGTAAGLSATLVVGSGGTGLTSGTSGGVLYYSASNTLASSSALAANALVIGGGAGVAPSTTTTAAGILTFLGTPSSANLASAVTDETGSGLLVFGTSPTLTTPRVAGSSTGYTTLASANSSATNYTLTLPAATGTVSTTGFAVAMSVVFGG